MENKNSNITSLLVPFLIVLLVIISFFAGGLWTKLKNTNTAANTNTNTDTNTDTNGNTNTKSAPTADGTDGTFSYKNDLQICKSNGKPVIYLFSTTWCPHCQWIKDTFDKVAKEYVAAGKIEAYHWELDTGDDTLTTATETAAPAAAQSIYQEFNPDGTIPTFVFGCKYWRVGNGHESKSDLAAEEAEFRSLFDKLVAAN